MQCIPVYYTYLPPHTVPTTALGIIPIAGGVLVVVGANPSLTRITVQCTCMREARISELFLLYRLFVWKGAIIPHPSNSHPVA